MANNIQHNGFKSRTYGRGRRKYTSRYFSRGYAKRNYKQANGGNSMLAKIGVCVLLAGLAVLSEYADSSADIMEVSSEISTDKANEQNGGDYLGKLRFVELPGIMQVFSSDAKFRVGVEYDEWKINDEKSCITVKGINGACLPAPADCTVKSVNADDSGITTVIMAADGDITISCSAGSEAAVEEGQPLKCGDTLFASVDSVDISMTKGGRPVDPSEYYDMDGVRFS